MQKSMNATGDKKLLGKARLTKQQDHKMGTMAQTLFDITQGAASSSTYIEYRSRMEELSEEVGELPHNINLFWLELPCTKVMQQDKSGEGFVFVAIPLAPVDPRNNTNRCGRSMLVAVGSH